jgi:superfamily I DNA/RNA helicase
LFAAFVDGTAEPRGSCIASFTRAATEDVNEGLAEAVEENDEYPESFADVDVVTFNALCLRAARMDGFEDSDLISLDAKGDEEVFRAFFAEEMPGITFKTPNPEDFEIDSPGAKMVHEYNLIRAEGGTDIADFARESQGRDLGCQRPDFLRFVALWQTWKRETGNRQHDDYVEYVLDNELVPDVPGSDDSYNVLVVDEFQDLNPIQYVVYKLWRESDEFDRIIIAGDAAQSIYGFRGADPRYFVHTPADEVIELAESRRCAPEVIEYADSLIAGEDYFESKLSSAREDNDFRGMVKDYSVSDLDALTRLVRKHTDMFNSTYVLARRNKDVGKIARALNRAGIPHLSVSPAAAGKHEGLWYWDEPLGDLLVLFRNWENRKTLSPLWVNEFLKNTTVENVYSENAKLGIKYLLKNAPADAPEMTRHGMCPPEVMDYVTDGMSVAEALVSLDLNEARVDALKNALRSGTNAGPSQVRAGTIHSSKGLECDAAIIMGYTTGQRLKTLNEGGEELAEEKRLYHVGVTRAQDSVVIVSGVFGSERSPVLP